MGTWILVLLGAISALLCIVICVREIVIDVKRWVKIFKEENEAEERPVTEYPALRLVKTKN